eukprot:scaffold2875_cov247-Pinguiococcus_pyrenoidosus.AAC.3
MNHFAPHNFKNGYRYAQPVYGYAMHARGSQGVANTLLLSRKGMPSPLRERRRGGAAGPKGLFP